MLFGATPFANSPFADPGGVSIFFQVTGSQINVDTGTVGISASATVLPDGSGYEVTIGNVTIKIGKTVAVNGVRINLANSEVSVVSWNPIPPGVSQVWVPIDPDNP